MPRFNNTVRTLGLAILIPAGLVGMLVWTRTLLSVDPFRDLKRQSPIGEDISVQLDNVAFKEYAGPNLIAKMDVGRMEVRNDRQIFNFEKITNGDFSGKNRKLKFDGLFAFWNDVTRQLTAPSGGHIYGDKVNLKTSYFTIDQPNGIMQVTGKVQGQLGDGELMASDLRYDIGSGDYEAHAVVWTGEITKEPLQDSDQPKRSKWTVKTLDEKSVVRHKGDMDYWPNCEATDGEVIVRAKAVERNAKTDVLTAIGQVSYFSQKTNMTCEKAVIYRKEKRAVLSGHVNVVFKAEDQQEQPLAVVEIPPFRPLVPDDIAASRPAAPADTSVSDEQKKLDEEVQKTENRRKYPTLAMADQVEYWYAKGSRHAIITGSPQARQELPGGRWRHVWTDSATYDGEKELLRMKSSGTKRTTRMKTSLGDDLRSDWIELSTKDEDDSWSSGPMEGDLYTDEDIPKEKPKKGKGGGKQPEALPGKVTGGGGR
ncbi:MAG: hypothetical protein JSS72_13220 [Armatimonadetes bacterium]|nr:hypothetical protein [Armatimonadota bacterium]